MHQGRASSSHAGSTKTEPKSSAIDPGAVSQIGIREINTGPEPLVTGRGYSAPGPVATTVHHCGSQGTHK